MKQDRIPFGADIKLQVKLTELGDNVHLEDASSYNLTFTAGAKSKTFAVNAPSNPATTGVTKIDADTVAVALKTSDLDRGDIHLKAIVVVEDEAFSSGTRTEIIEHDLQLTIQ